MVLDFAIPIHITELPIGGLTICRLVDPEAYAQIASRLAVDAVEEFLIEVSVQRDQKHKSIAMAQGKIKVTVIQSCSVTLEPITSKFCIPIDLTFADEGALTPAEDINFDEADPPEPMHDGRFDLGDTLIQILAVEINPFPRKPGSSIQDISSASPALSPGTKLDSSEHPFSPLAKLKEKLERQ